MYVADLFAGCGGLALGFAHAGFTVVWGGEANAAAAQTFAAAFPEAETFNGFITEDTVLPRVDVIVGGPPCQPYSSAGARKGVADPRDGLPVFFHHVARTRPRVFAMEEVPGILHDARFRWYLEDAARFGYHVQTFVLDAADYGCAQRRSRLFVVGLRDGAPVQTPLPHPRVSIAEALYDLVPWFDPGPTRHSRPVLRKTPLSSARIVDRGRQGVQARKVRGYQLTRPHEQARTITKSAEAKGSEHAIRIAVAHAEGEFIRRLSNAELARLQGFPDGYPWQGHPRAVARQIGNAVAPPVAYELARAICDVLA